MAVMPALFIGHGSPMNTLADNRYTNAWRQIGESVPKPRAILVVSAHWYIGATAVTAMEQPRTIHDFYGFPPELFAVQYPAPGAPDVAQEVVDVLAPLWVGLDRDQWGLDHGTWSILVHMFPAADIPVLQLSLNVNKPIQYHFEVGARLAPLRENGVLIVGSGNVVHNLRRVDRHQADTGFDWAHRFDDAVLGHMTSDPSQVLSVLEHPDYDLAVPTPDHFIPLLYIAGLASAAGSPATALLRGYSMGALSMTAYGVGMAADTQETGKGSATIPTDVPADNTNT